MVVDVLEDKQTDVQKQNKQNWEAYCWKYSHNEKQKLFNILLITNSLSMCLPLCLISSAGRIFFYNGKVVLKSLTSETLCPLSSFKKSD